MGNISSVKDYDSVTNSHAYYGGKDVQKTIVQKSFDHPKN